MIYKQITDIPHDYIINSINHFLNEDFPFGDATTDSIFPESTDIAIADIEAKEDLVLSGSNLIKYFFPDSKIEYYYKDSDLVEKGKIITKIYASSSDILKKERVFLNLLQRMSGIATITSKYVKKVSKDNIFILDTRKTTPGLRYFEKYAVNCGGGKNHRFDLTSAVMIKDNHIASAGSISNAIKLVLDKNLNKIIEIEVDNIEQLKEAIMFPIDSVLLDNFNRDNTIKAVEIIKKMAINKNLFIESSGGITLENIEDYIGTGIDAISSGALTHSVKSADIGLNLVKI